MGHGSRTFSALALRRRLAVSNLTTQVGSRLMETMPPRVNSSLAPTEEEWRLPQPKTTPSGYCPCRTQSHPAKDSTCAWICVVAVATILTWELTPLVAN